MTSQFQSKPSIDWREAILKEFPPRAARLTLVADPDGLVTEERVIQRIRESGYDLLLFDESVRLRFAYELKYRLKWDRGERADLVIAFKNSEIELQRLPYDLLHGARKLSFSLGGLFPNLSYPVVATLDKGDLDTVFQAQREHNPGNLGDNATKDFLLLHVYGEAPQFVKKEVDLLRLLLRRHYRAQTPPAALDDRLIQLLRQGGRFEDWPLEVLIRDKASFFLFLQERWPLFVERAAAGHGGNLSEQALTIAGPPQLPLDHEDVRVYIDNLFLEGVLKPVDFERSDLLHDKWVTVGIRTDPVVDAARRLERLVASVAQDVPSADVRHQDWLLFATKWAQLLVLRHAATFSERPDMIEKILEVERTLDGRFTEWLEKRYAGLHNQPWDPPVMVHHVPRALAAYREDSPHERVALIVVDGLSLDQWMVLRGEWLKREARLELRERSLFAWIPTLTSISRQAIFAGEPPLYFPDTIGTTDKEPLHWSRFWAEHGLGAAEVRYAKGLGNIHDIRVVDELTSDARVRVVGVVLDTVDRILHGMELGTSGMHNQVRLWVAEGFARCLIDLLLERHFRVFLSSDHGNIQAAGCGRPAEGCMAEIKGQRVRVYSDPLLRSQVKARFPEAVEWPGIGLPEDYLPLLAPPRSAFIPVGEHSVSHGGSSLEEVVVPFIEVRKRT
jgi:hypothetical protein